MGVERAVKVPSGYLPSLPSSAFFQTLEGLLLEVTHISMRVSWD